jgi:hypothetical protein
MVGQWLGGMVQYCSSVVGRHGGSVVGGMVAQCREAWWLSGGRHGGSVVGGMVAQWFRRHGGSVVGGMVAQWWEARWLSGSPPDCCPAVPGSNLASPQPKADCKLSGGSPPEMALGCGLTSVRGDRGEDYEK